MFIIAILIGLGVWCLVFDLYLLPAYIVQHYHKELNFDNLMFSKDKPKMANDYSDYDDNDYDKPKHVDDNANDMEKDNNYLPWLILHVGPQKTATSTIQKGFIINSREIAKDDNYYYMGTAFTKTTVALDNEGTESEFEKFTMFKLQDFPWTDIKGGPEFIDQLDIHHQHGRNVVLSSEHLVSWTPSLENVFHHFMGRFRVKVVVTYRHFFEWLPSKHYQFYLDVPKPETINTSNYVPGIVEFVEDYLNRMVAYDPDNNETTINTTADLSGHGGNKNTNTLKSIWRKKNQETSHGSIWAYLRFSSRPDLFEKVDIFDMHQQLRPSYQSNDAIIGKRDLFAEFVCQILPSAYNTCQRLMKDKTDPIHERSSSTESIISMSDKIRIFFKVFKLQDYSKWNTRPHREFPRRIDHWFHHQANLTASEFKELQICLSSASLDRLKIASWNSLLQIALLLRSHALSRRQKNDAYYSSLFQSTKPTNHLILSSQQLDGDDDDDDDNDAWIMSLKAAHHASFDEFISKGNLCEINVEKLLENEEFIRYVFLKSP